MQAFLITNDCPPYQRTKSHLASVDRLGELTGLDFFPEFPTDAQAQLASRLLPRWVPRYATVDSVAKITNPRLQLKIDDVGNITFQLSDR